MKYKYNGQWLTIPTGGGSGLPDPSASDKMLISNDSLEWEEIDKEDVGTPTWTGTQAEYEIAESDIADGTIVNITDDDGNMVGARTTEIYSTDEIIIGKWIDGKPIYRKVLQSTLPTCINNGTSGVIQIPTNINNIERITQLRYVIESTAADNKFYFTPFGYGGDTPQNGVRMYYSKVHEPIETNVIVLRNANSGYNNFPVIIIMEYTKTTD